MLESAGQDQALRTITHLPDPDALYLEICDLLFGPRPGAPGGPPSSTTWVR